MVAVVYRQCWTFFEADELKIFLFVIMIIKRKDKIFFNVRDIKYKAIAGKKSAGDVLQVPANFFFAIALCNGFYALR